MFNTSDLGQIKIYLKYFIHQLHSNLGGIEIKILFEEAIEQ